MPGSVSKSALDEVERRLNNIGAGVSPWPPAILGDLYAYRTPLYEGAPTDRGTRRGRPWRKSVSAVLRALGKGERGPCRPLNMATKNVKEESQRNS